MTSSLAQRLGPEVAAAFAAYAGQPHERPQSFNGQWRFALADEARPFASALAEADPTLGDDGWELDLVDLREVRAIQPLVSLDDPRCIGVGRELSVAQSFEICVPAYPPAVPATAFDERASSWVLRGASSNLRITGRFAGPVEGSSQGSNGFGFLVSAQPSRLEIVTIDGVPVLRDGYHRAVGLLAQGVTVVPALVAPHDVDLGVDGGFDVGVVIAPDGPRLVDFFDDEVARDVSISKTERALIIQALDIELPA